MRGRGLLDALCRPAPGDGDDLILTITPIDFHADREDASHGFINLWTRNLNDDDINRLIDAFGNLPGEIMGRCSS